MNEIKSKLSQRQLAPILRFSAVLHILLVLWLMFFPQYWRWTLACMICDHLTLVIAGFLPRSRILGQNWTKLPLRARQQNAIALTIDDGPDAEVTPKVLDILDSYQAKATFFCIGERAQNHPELCKEILKRGHAIENHTQHHWHYFSLLLRPKQIRAEIQAAQQTLTAITGCEPLFFRPTAGLRNFLLESVLSSMGLRLVSWTRRGFDTRQADSAIVLQKLLKNLQAGDILLLHDGNAARTANGIPIILEVLPELLTAIKAAQLKTVTLRSFSDCD